MSTTKQRKLARLLIENAQLDKPLNKGEMLVKVGYAESVAGAKANDIIEAQGVKDALEDEGFTIENAKSVVQEIMMDRENDPSSRLKATDQVFKVHGAYAPEKSITLNIDAVIPDERLLEIAQNLNEVARIGEAEPDNSGGSESSDGVNPDPVDTEAQNQNV